MLSPNADHLPPDPINDADAECYKRIFSSPWLKKCIVPTGSWGRRIADVQVLGLPPNMIVHCLLVDSVPQDLKIVLDRWDYKSENGWSTFDMTLKFPNGATQLVTIPASSELGDGHSLVVQINQSVILIERKHQLERRIPRVFFNLSPPLASRAPHIQKHITLGRRIIDIVQCTSLFLVLEDDDMQRMVDEATEIPNFREAYNAVIPVSYKADLMRYYLLYKFGGVYHDDKSVVRYSLDSPVFDSILGGEGNKEKRCDMFISSIGDVHEIAYIAARTDSPIMLMALQKSIANIMDRRYGLSSLSITGNLMLTPLLNSKRLKFIDKIHTTGIAAKLNIKWEECQGEIIAPLAIDNSLHRIYLGKVGWGANVVKIVEALGMDPPEARARLAAATGGEVDVLWEKQSIHHSNWPRLPTYYSNLWSRRGVYIDGNNNPLFGVYIFGAIALIIILGLILKPTSLAVFF